MAIAVNKLSPHLGGEITDLDLAKPLDAELTAEVRQVLLRAEGSIEMAVTAPSASNKQPWRFFVTDDRSIIDRMAEEVQQAVDRIEIVKPPQHRPFYEDAERADQNGHDDESGPEIDVQILDADPHSQIGVENERQERAGHVEGAVSEIDHVEEAEDHRQSEAEHGVENAVVQPEHGLRQYEIQHGGPLLTRSNNG